MSENAYSALGGLAASDAEAGVESVSVDAVLMLAAGADALEGTAAASENLGMLAAGVGSGRVQIVRVKS